jgi:carbamoyl-phosphate synthase large subunit
MRSTGEVMGLGDCFGEAYAKGELATGLQMPKSGRVFLSVKETDKKHCCEIATQLIKHGFEIISTHGTATILEENNIACQHVNKVTEGRPHIVDMIKNDEIAFIINTTEGKQAIADSFTIRRSAVQHGVPYTTTIAGGKATCLALQYDNTQQVRSLQKLYTSFNQNQANSKTVSTE